MHGCEKAVAAAKPEAAATTATALTADEVAGGEVAWVVALVAAAKPVGCGGVYLGVIVHEERLYRVMCHER